MYNGIVTVAKPIRWIGSSRKDLKRFPKAVRYEIGSALYAAQMGDTDPAAKALRAFKGRGVLEVITLSRRHLADGLHSPL